MSRIPFELSLTGQPRSWLVQDKSYSVNGYQGARWGMYMGQVRTLIGAAYPDSCAGLRCEVDTLAGSISLALALPALAPGPGPATIRYVFGLHSQKLVAVHLDWVVDGDPAHEQRLPLVQAATRLVAGLVGYRWPGQSPSRGVVRGTGALLLFAARDELGRGVEIRLDGVGFDVERREPPGPPEHRPAPRGPAGLRQSFFASGE